MSEIELDYEVNPVAVAVASVAALLVAAGLITLLVVFKPEAGKAAPAESAPLVEVIVAVEGDEKLKVPSQGIVVPRTETMASSDVSGRVIEVGDRFQRGATFKKGDILLKIDPANYLAALAQAEAELADARLAVKLEEAKQKQALRDWKKLGASGEPGELVARGPQLGSANARVRAAVATVARAQRDLDQTSLKAPYDGRIRSTSTNLGSYVTPGAPLADMFSTAVFEVALPLSLNEFNFIAEPGSGDPVSVALRTAAGTTWDAKIVRTSSSIDSKTRSISVIAEIDQTSVDGVPGAVMAPGLFVDAEIEGRTLPGVVAIPRRALYGVKQNEVWVVDADDRLQSRTVETVRAESDRVFVRHLEGAARVCVSPLSTPFAGMKVTVGESEVEGGEGGGAGASGSVITNVRG